MKSGQNLDLRESTKNWPYLIRIRVTAGAIDLQFGAHHFVLMFSDGFQKCGIAYYENYLGLRICPILRIRMPY
jgi:hypothetical protein